MVLAGPRTIITCICLLVLINFTLLRVTLVCYCYCRYGLLCRKSNKADFDQQLQASSDKLSVISVIVTVVVMLLVICSFLLLLYYFYYPVGKPARSECVHVHIILVRVLCIPSNRIWMGLVRFISRIYSDCRANYIHV